MKKTTILLIGILSLIILLFSYSFVEVSIAENIPEYQNYNDSEIKIERKAIIGRINYSLFSTFSESVTDPDLAKELSSVFAYLTEYSNLQKGDYYKVIYEREVIGKKPTGIRKVLGVNLHHAGKDYYAFNFNQNGRYHYYNEEGNALKKIVIKHPLNYTTITSRYSPRRFHPVLRRYKAHLGTDFAAPAGTPIKAAGDGIVIAASYNRGNGRFVKIEHNKTYTTQYLHMSGFAGGIKKGVKVKQGQIIGYVGSTGLATGPHLCFRFWKNGKQINPFKDKTPAQYKSIGKDSLPKFEKYKEEIKEELNLLGLPLDNAIVNVDGLRVNIS